MVGGLILAQIVTLYLTPVFYLYMESLVGLVRRLRHKPAPELVPIAIGAEGNGNGHGGDAVMVTGGEEEGGRL